MTHEDSLYLADTINQLHEMQGHKMDIVDYCTFIEWLERHKHREFKNAVSAYKEFTGGSITDKIHNLHAPDYIYDEYCNRLKES